MRRPCSPRTSWVCVARMTTIHLERASIGKGRGTRERTDISHRGRDADLDTRVSFLCQLALEKFIQFGVEDAVGDEFPTLGDGGSWYRSHDGGACFGIWGWSRNAVVCIENC